MKPLVPCFGSPGTWLPFRAARRGWQRPRSEGAGVNGDFSQLVGTWDFWGEAPVAKGSIGGERPARKSPRFLLLLLLSRDKIMSPSQGDAAGAGGNLIAAPGASPHLPERKKEPVQGQCCVKPASHRLFLHVLEAWKRKTIPLTHPTNSNFIGHTAGLMNFPPRRGGKVENKTRDRDGQKELGFCSPGEGVLRHRGKKHSLKTSTCLLSLSPAAF